jgi:hypothetical protein
MTSLRQIEANRRNSEKSTGPKTEHGKRHSRRNAFRHGLCAETVIELLEDVKDYQAFETTITLDYDACTAVERELVLRLASLLWRIRRATAIDTDLFRMQVEILRDRRDRSEQSGHSEQPQRNVIYGVAGAARQGNSLHPNGSLLREAAKQREHTVDLLQAGPSRDLSQSFLQLASLENAAFERLARYEARLWRQLVQTLFALHSVRRGCAGRPQESSVTKGFFRRI